MSELVPDAPPQPVDLESSTARFTSNLRAARKIAGMSQQAVALAAGMDQAHYSGIELGKHDPGVRTLTRLAVVLGTTPSDLLDGILDDA